MPELPEVETIKNAVAPLIVGQDIVRVNIFNPNLRWQVDKKKLQSLSSEKILSIQRKAKYIVIYFEKGHIIIHLGMSGNLHFQKNDFTPLRHDHAQFKFKKYSIFYNDPRRFGSIHFAKDLDSFFLFKNIGLEPLSDLFDDSALFKMTRNRKTSIKQLIMNGSLIVGVGNIYASESLFRSKIRPSKPAKNITKKECVYLVRAIKQVLKDAIKLGGSSIRDFKQLDGSSGYFKIKHNVYGREGEDCNQCSTKIKKIIISGRSTFYCSKCQS